MTEEEEEVLLAENEKRTEEKMATAMIHGNIEPYGL